MQLNVLAEQQTNIDVKTAMLFAGLLPLFPLLDPPLLPTRWPTHVVLHSIPELHARSSLILLFFFSLHKLKKMSQSELIQGLDSIYFSRIFNRFNVLFDFFKCKKKGF